MSDLNGPVVAPQHAALPSRLPRDLFSNLPAELHKMIFEELKALGGKPMTGAISKVFLPYTNHLLYEQVTITTFSGLRLFMNILCVKSRSERVLASVQRIADRVERFTLGPFDDSEVDQVNSLPNPELLLLFKRLTGAWSVTIIGVTRVAKYLIDGPVTKKVLPTLQYLDLEDVFGSWDSPFDARHYQNLANYPLLSYLGIHVGRWKDGIAARTTPRPSPAPNPTLQYLLLRGEISRNKAAVADLASGFPNLESLDVMDSSVAFDLDQVLQVLPATLRSLNLSRSRTSRIASSTNLATLLSRFTSLSCLEIGGRDVLNPAIYQTISKLPLAFLRFTHGAELDVDEITKLTSGEAKMGTLKTISFDVWSCKRGPRIMDAHDMEWYDEYDCYGPLPGWQIPDWEGKAFDAEAARKVLKIAETEGVEIEELEDAVKVYDDWMHEWDIAAAIEELMEAELEEFMEAELEKFMEADFENEMYEGKFDEEGRI